MMPPLALRILRAACSRGDWPWIEAEMKAEYVQHVLPRHGTAGARRWLWAQALRSTAALAVNGLRTADWEYALLMILLASAGPVVLTEAGWGYLLSLVPLKAGVARGADFVLVCLGAHGILGFLAGTQCAARALWLAIPAAWIFAFLGHVAARGATPSWFFAAALLTLAASLGAGAAVRRWFETPQGGRSV